MSKIFLRSFLCFVFVCAIFLVFWWEFSVFFVFSAFGVRDRKTHQKSTNKNDRFPRIKLAFLVESCADFESFGDNNRFFLRAATRNYHKVLTVGQQGGLSREF